MLVINLLGGPGVGKTAVAAGLFSRLRALSVSAELIAEVAKGFTWERRKIALSNQLYVLAKQYQMLWRVHDQVDVAVTDAPLLLAHVHAGPNMPPSFNPLVDDLFDSFDNLIYRIARTVPFEAAGRNEDEARAIEIDRTVEAMLKSRNTPYVTIDGPENAVSFILEDLQRRRPDIFMADKAAA